METLKFWLKGGIALEIVFQVISIIIDIAFLNFESIPTRIISSIIICGILAIALSIVNKIIELEERVENISKSLGEYKAQANRQASQIERKISQLDEKSFTTILPSTYIYDKGNKKIAVKGKMDYTNYVGFKCPICGTVQRATNLSCRSCNVRVEYE